jgi:hypothetical protein
MEDREASSANAAAAVLCDAQLCYLVTLSVELPAHEAMHPQCPARRVTCNGHAPAGVQLHVLLVPPCMCDHVLLGDVGQIVCCNEHSMGVVALQNE